MGTPPQSTFTQSPSKSKYIPEPTFDDETSDAAGIFSLSDDEEGRNMDVPMDRDWEFEHESFPGKKRLRNDLASNERFTSPSSLPGLLEAEPMKHPRFTSKDGAVCNALDPSN